MKTPGELVHAVQSGLDGQDQGIITIVNVLMEPGGEMKWVTAEPPHILATDDRSSTTGWNSDGWQAQRRRATQKPSCKYAGPSCRHKYAVYNILPHICNASLQPSACTDRRSILY